MKKDYTKFSESSNNKNEDPVVTDEELDAMNNDAHMVSPELEETVLRADGEVMRNENPEVTEEMVGAVANAIVNEAKETDKTVETVVNEIIDETKDDNSIQNDEPNQNDEPEIEEVVMHLEEAKVSCKNRLNVRKEPSKEAEILCAINNGIEVIVDTVNSTDDFYKVIVNHNNKEIEGYCMKQFISIK